MTIEKIYESYSLNRVYIQFVQEMALLEICVILNIRLFVIFSID